MPLFLSAAKARAAIPVGNPAHNQSTDFRLHNGTEVFCSQQAPGPAIQNENGIGSAGDRLYTVKLTFNIVIFSLVSVVDIGIVMIVRCTQTEHQAGSSPIPFSKLFILQEIFQLIAGVLDGKAAAFGNRIGFHPSVTGADQMVRGDVGFLTVPFPDKEIPERTVLPQLLRRQGDRIPPGIPAEKGPGPARAQIANNQTVGVKLLNQLQKAASERSSICLTKTMSIKAMADKLFEYFLVYTSEWEQPELETCDADEVFTQFWQEYAFTLESHGFAVEMDFGELGGKVAVNLELLRRAFDNLYSNLVKYAEPSKPVQIACHREDDQVLLTISNAVSSQRDNRESTNIGLNTCRRIMKMLGGSFETNEADGVFTVKLRLPFS